MPPYMPDPKGGPVMITTFVDVDHAHYLKTSQSVTGVLVFLKKKIQWYSRRNNAVETSTYVSDMAAMIISMGLTMTMRYNIRVIGFTIYGPSQMMVDNEIMVTSFSITYITLNNNHNAIFYHQVGEAVAAGVISLEHIPGESKPSDLLNKSLGTHQHYPLIKEFVG